MGREMIQLTADTGHADISRWYHMVPWQLLVAEKKTSIPFFHQYGTVPYRIPKVSQITLMKYVSRLHMHISSNVPQPTCRGPYAWLQYPYNILNLLASRFGAVWLLAIILESHAATLARFANSTSSMVGNSKHDNSLTGEGWRER